MIGNKHTKTSGEDARYFASLSILILLFVGCEDNGVNPNSEIDTTTGGKSILRSKI